MAEKYTKPELAGIIRRTVPGYSHQDDDTVLMAAFAGPRGDEFKSWLTPEPLLVAPTKFQQMKDLAAQAFEAAAPAGLSESLRYKNLKQPALPAGLSAAARAAAGAVGGQVRTAAAKPLQTIFPPTEDITAINAALNIRPWVERKITQPIMRAVAPVGVEIKDKDQTQHIISRTVMETLNELVPMSPAEAAGWVIGPKAAEAGIKGGLLALSKVAPKMALKMVAPVMDLGSVDTLFSRIKTVVERKTGFKIPDSTWAPLQDDMAQAILKRKMGIKLKQVFPKPTQPRPETPAPLQVELGAPVATKTAPRTTLPAARQQEFMAAQTQVLQNIIDRGDISAAEIPILIKDKARDGITLRAIVERKMLELPGKPAEQIKQAADEYHAFLKGIQMTAAAQQGGKEIWDMPAEQLQVKIKTTPLLPPEWKTPAEVIADMGKYPREEAWRKWAAEDEIRARGTGHRLPPEIIEKYKLQDTITTAKEMETTVKSDMARDYLANRPGGVTPFLDQVVSMGYLNKGKLLRWLQIETGQDWKGRELPEELAWYVRPSGKAGIGDVTDALFFKGVVENDPNLIIAGLEQDYKIKKALKAGGDLTEILPKRDMVQYGGAYMGGPGPAAPISQPSALTEMGFGITPPKEVRDTLNSALTSTLPVEEKVNAFGQVLKFYLGTKRERFQVMAGDKSKGDAWYNAVRQMNVNYNSIKAIVEVRNREIFRGLPVSIRAYIHDIAKGISKDAKGEIVGGGLQPAGIIKEKNARVGQIYTDGRIVGSALEEGGDEYQMYRYFNTLGNYTELIGKYPQAKVVFNRLLALDEEIKKTKLGEELPAFAREVMQRQYDIKSVHPQDYRYVPSIPAEQKLLTKIGNLFKSYTASGRKYKTGILAETNQEDKDLLKTLTSKHNEFAFERLFNNTVGDILTTILEPIGRDGVKPGFIGVDLNKPKLQKVLEMKKDLLLANGIDFENINKFQYPMAVEKEFNLQATAKFGPEMQAVVDGIAKRTNQIVGYILSNYLIRLSTAVRNTTSGFVQYNLRTLTHLYEGLMGEGFSPAMDDVKAMARALKPSVIKELPKEILGLNFYSDIPENIKIMDTALIPFRAVESYFKRASFDADLNTAAGNKFNEALAKGTVKLTDKEKFLQDYRVNYFQDLFNTMADNSDSVTFDYADKPYFLEKMSNTLGRGFVPYPNYMYHKWRMYAEFSPLQLAGINNSNYKHKTAKALAGVTMFTIAGAIADKIINERKKRLGELELRKMPWEFDTTGRIKVYADENIERWLRIYDLPFIGDTVYMMEILQNQAGVDDWARDSLAMGPIFNTIALFMGLKTKYTTGLAAASIAGGQAAGFIPFGAYLQYLRVLADPVKRQTYSQDYNAFQNFINPIIDIIPGKSKELELQIGKIGAEKAHVRKYDIPAETMKLFLLNIRSVDAKEYQQYVHEQVVAGRIRRREKKVEERDREIKLKRIRLEYEQLKLKLSKGP